MSTSPEDVADMFDLPPLPAAAESAADAAEAAQAELAAEIAAALESGDFAVDAPDSRTDPRVNVSWPARMQLPCGNVIDLQVRDVSTGGVGLMGDGPIPARTVVNFEMDVPPLDEGGRITSIKGTIKTTYAAAHGSEFVCGATWQAPPAGLELVKMWIKRLGR
jgi:hypothetical protein